MADSGSLKKCALLLDDNSGSVTILMSSLGPLYDIVIRQDDLLISRECALVKCVDVTHLFEREISRSVDSEHSSSSSGNRTLDRQATMFISLILEVWRSKQKQLHSYTVSPALHGLRNCIESGWRPDRIPSELVDMLVTLLDSSSDDGADSSSSGDSALELAQISQQILLAAMRKAPSLLKVRVSDSLASSMSSSASLTAEKMIVLCEASHFLAIDRRYASCYFPYTRSAFDLSERECIDVSSTSLSHSGGSPTPWPARLALSDRVEVRVGSGEWLLAHVVKVDSVTQRLLLEILNTTSTNNNNNDGVEEVVSEAAVTVAVEGYLQSSLIRPPEAAADVVAKTSDAAINSDASISITRKHRNGPLICALILGDASSSADVGLFLDSESLCECGHAMMPFSSHFSVEEASQGRCMRCAVPWGPSRSSPPAQRWICTANDCNRELCQGCLKYNDIGDYYHIYLESNEIHQSCPVYSSPSDGAAVVDTVRLGEVVEVHSASVDGYYRLLDDKGFVSTAPPQSVWGLAHHHSSASAAAMPSLLLPSSQPPRPQDVAFRIHVENHDFARVSGLYSLSHVAGETGAVTEIIHSRGELEEGTPVYTMGLADITYVLYCVRDDRSRWFIGVTSELNSLGSITKILASSTMFSNSAPPFPRAVTSCRWQSIAHANLATNANLWDNSYFYNRLYPDEWTNLRVFAIELLQPPTATDCAKHIEDRKAADGALLLSVVVQRCLRLDTYRSRELAARRLPAASSDDLYAGMLEELFRSVGNLLSRNVSSGMAAPSSREGDTLPLLLSLCTGGGEGRIEDTGVEDLPPKRSDIERWIEGHPARLVTHFAVSIFEFVIREIVMILCEKVDCCDAPNEQSLESTPATAQALRIVRLLLSSSFSSLLTVYFFDNITSRCALRAQILAQAALADPALTTDFDRQCSLINGTIDKMKALEGAYECILVSSLSGVEGGPEVLLSVTSRLRGAVEVVGRTVFADGAIDKISRAGSLLRNGSSFQRNGLAPSGGAVVVSCQSLCDALHDFVLCGADDRFSQGARHTRRVVAVLAAHMSARGQAALEWMWRSVVVDFATSALYNKNPLPSTRYSHLNSNISDAFADAGNVTADGDAFVRRLVQGLRAARDASTLDLSSCPLCRSTPEKAFGTAFSRLRKERAVEVAKALAIFVSGLLDAFKQEQQESSAGWGTDLKDVSDILRVLYGQASEQFQDFHFFYELLLARRLLRSRYLSLDMERQTLRLLPEMPKSLLMITDVSRTAQTMTAFQRFLLGRLDRGELPPAAGASARSLVFSGCLRLHTLSGSIWPTIWVSPLQFSGLKLPAPMALIAKEFETFFTYQDFRGYVDKGAGVFSNSMRPFPDVRVAGCSDLPVINGSYEATADNWNGFPVYRLRQSSAGGKYILELNADSGCWEIKGAVSKSTNKCIARSEFSCGELSASSNSNLSKVKWSVFVDGCWQPCASMTASPSPSVPVGAGSGLSSLIDMEAAVTRPRRRLYWCRGAGSVVLRARVSGGHEASLLTSEPQAVLLMALAGLCSSERLTFTLRSLMEIVGLSLGELQVTLRSLSTDKQRVLSDQTLSTSPDQELCLRSVFNEDFLSGRLPFFAFGGSDDEPTVLSTFVSKDGIPSSAGITSIHGWRNDLIDAGIVRALKEALKSSSGELASSRGKSSAALTVDILLQEVKLSLSQRCNVCFEDIVRRSERLVGIGIIEKVRGDPDTLRSYAYCYLSDSDTNPISAAAPARVTHRLYGDDLYSQLRSVLGIGRLPAGVPGISRELFASRVVAWFCMTPIDTESMYAGRAGVADVAFLVAALSRALLQQLVVLEVQKSAGRGSAPGDAPGWLGQIERLVASLSRLEATATSAQLFAKLGLARTFYRSLPMADKCRLVSAYYSFGAAARSDERLSADALDEVWDSRTPFSRQVVAERLPKCLHALLGFADEFEPVGMRLAMVESYAEGKCGEKNETGLGLGVGSIEVSFSSFCEAVALNSALVPSASPTMTTRAEKKVTFGELLTINVAESFGTAVRTLFQSEHEAKEAAAAPFANGAAPMRESGGAASSASSDEQFNEVLLPCEFCPDLFPMSQLTHHQTLCREARSRGEVLVVAPARPAAGGSKLPRHNGFSATPGAAGCDSTSFASISTLSDATLQLVESALSDAISNTCGGQCATIANVLADCFNDLDTNRDGYLTRSDFSNPDDPSDANLNPNWSKPPHMSSPVELYAGGSKVLDPGADSTSPLDIDSEDEQSPMPSSPSLARFDSLWASLLQEKFLPSPSKSRSLDGISGAETELQALIDRVREVLYESESTTISLLLYAKWDSRALIEDYVEDAPPLRKAAGLGPSSRPSFLRFDLFGKSSCDSLLHFGASGVKCGICADEVPADDAFALNCAHYYCRDCWGGYLCSAVGDRQVRIHCPFHLEPKCPFLVPYDMIEFLCARDVYLEARGGLVKEFVEEKRGKHVVSYCKNPRGCDGVLFMADDATLTETTCSLCASTFCANCDFPPHAPASCELVSGWSEAGGYLETGRDGDMEARKLKHLTTKPCPKCGARIEKNGGCPHMSCFCKYQFCWECGGEYHTSVACTRRKIVPDSGSILHFDEMDKQVANHFLARQVAVKGAVECQYQEDCAALSPAMRAFLGEKKVGWECLAQAQSALAHSCIIQYSVRGAKLNYLFGCLKDATQSLQQKFEEAWVGPENFPEHQARAAVRALRSQLREYLLLVSTEISFGAKQSPPSPKTAQQLPVSPAAGGGSGSIFGDVVGLELGLGGVGGLARRVLSAT